MIKHHPKFELLQSFVNGDLPASLSVGISIHASMCTVCQQKISLLTDQVADLNFDESYANTAVLDHNSATQELSAIDFEDMISAITETEHIDVMQAVKIKSVNFRDKSYQLPTALNSMLLGKTAHIGKLARRRIQLDENEIHTNLLHMEPDGSVPQHTHKGFELTLLLEGSFHDEEGEYVKGDFIMLDGQHLHNPISSSGCLCYTVANDSMHFTQGINKLLNPIGSFIY
ncbi:MULTISPECIES: ChrR family anti-sigma-E factor [unclassified Colwellia]|uniref:ChrR family anti-sigma-E factor n=1 Tax=unclassified Colwellia TaxID=196834 RepID=UPI0015F3A9CA|nr:MULTISPECIES: ChrR family anti-sigma-E factor [unclassified Colwellia]MBA6233867.1 cupin domain-containing protein [Colwellia sp. MB02u-7]MBA6237317.1 cupin domain-containing protein [Colwellia sp. MB02u-11]MBA6300317.1 cupin domain-containing protein [Colwellia sp. MB3u-22]MBA6310908.1 cupin domain-containing protein [Colwellia sp. MB3u-64]